MSSSSSSDTFTITADPGTDIWRKPPSTNVFNAPYAPTRFPPGCEPLSPVPPSKIQVRASGRLDRFLSAQLSFNFTPTQQYDQAGLLLTFHDDGNRFRLPGESPPKWIKTGIELYNGKPRLSTVSCDNWADWSVTDFPDVAEAGQKVGWTTMLIEKDKDGNGTGLWVYRVLPNGEKVPLREICWVFGLLGKGEEDSGNWTVDVAAMVARPAKEGTEGLTAEFKGLEVKWAESRED